MRDVVLFVEDEAHKVVIRRVLQRLAEEHEVEVRLDWRKVVGGHGGVVQELRAYLRDIKRYKPLPDLIVVATDANCMGRNGRMKEIRATESPAPMVCAIPDPHIERWLLLDGAAFKAVLGRGCHAPDRKCDRDRYKERLIEAIRAAGVRPILGGIEYADEIMRAADLPAVSRSDRSFRHFMDDVRRVLRGWRS